MVNGFISTKAAFENGIARPFNPDQMVYCMSEYLFIENSSSPERSLKNPNKKCGIQSRKGAVPKVIIIQNEGVIVAEGSPVSVGIPKDIVNDFCEIGVLSENFGGPHPLTAEQAAFIENWEVVNYRKKVSWAESHRDGSKIKLFMSQAQPRDLAPELPKCFLLRGPILWWPI